MRLNDITVEVRDKNLVRLGQIRPEELDIEISDLHNNVGTWSLKLPAEHPLAGALRQPGSGIIVSGPDDVLLSGPTIKNEDAATATDPGGTVSFEGVDDTVLLADALSLPEPTNPNPATQTLSHDVRTGAVETVMHAYVNANIGPAAPSARRSAALVAKVTMGTNLGRGPTVTKSARFPVLGNLLAELAVSANLGFRIVQRGSNLVFETYEVVDRSAEVRLDIHGNTLAGYRTAISPPGATQVLVAGQGDLVDRQFIHVTSPESLAAEASWGRRIERFVDQRQTDDVSELTQAGVDVLTEEGFTAFSVQAVPMDNSAAPFGTAWGVGDRVAIIVGDQELYSTVTGYVLKADKEGFRLGAMIGDPIGFDPDAALGKRVKGVERRVSGLERNAEPPAPYVLPADVVRNPHTGNFTVKDAATAAKAIRVRTTGGAIDFETGGADMLLSTITNADFTGSINTKAILPNGSGPISFPAGAQSLIAASAANDLTRKTDVAALIAAAPRGAIAYGQRSAGPKSGITAEVGVLRLNTTMLAGRAYLVTAGHVGLASTINEVMMTGLVIRWETNGTNASLASGEFTSYQGDTQSGTGGGPGDLQRVFHVGGSNLTASFLITARRIAGSGTLTIAGSGGGGPELHVIDIGPALTNTGVDI